MPMNSKSAQLNASSWAGLVVATKRNLLDADFMLPFFFFFVAFSWPLQVVFSSPVIALITYVPLLALAITMAKRPKAYLENLSFFDYAFLGALSLVVLHAIINLLLGNSEPSFQLKWILIFGTSALIYVHVSRRASINAIQFVIAAIIIAASALAIHWVWESYAKTVLRELSWYAIQSIKYVLVRNNYDMEQLNSSIASVEYRAYGLLDKHTTTSAYVASGIFALLSLSFSRRLLFKNMIFVIGLFILFIGLGTTTFLAYLMLGPLCMFLSAEPRKRIAAAFSAVALVVGFFFFVNFASASESGIGKLLDHRFMTLKIQLHFLTNFSNETLETKFGPLDTSFPKVYAQESTGFISFLSSHPRVALLGEGMGQNSREGFQRGGDLAVMEFFVTFGLPLSGVLMLAAFGLVGLAIRDLLRPATAVLRPDFLLFGCLVVLLLMISLGHYNTLFKKEIFPILIFALALLRRFSAPLFSHSNSDTANIDVGLS